MSGVVDAREKLAIDFNETWKAWLHAKDFVVRAEFFFLFLAYLLGRVSQILRLETIVVHAAVSQFCTIEVFWTRAMVMQASRICTP